MRIFLVILMLLCPTTAMAQHGGWGHSWHPQWNPGWNQPQQPIPGIIGGIIGGGIINLLFPPQPQVIVVPQQPVVVVPELVPLTPAWYAYCINKYKSFNPQTGTYTGFDMQAHPCGQFSK